MKSVFNYFIFFFFFMTFVMGQSKGLKCGWYGNKSVEERRDTFPFNKAKKVYLVSFPSTSPRVIDEETGNEYTVDSISYSKLGYKIIEVIGLPDKKESKYLLTEKIQLNQPQIDLLSNLLLNFTINKKKIPVPYAITVIGCFNPRNAILFVDEDEEIISYIEVCFECMQFYQRPHETIKYFNTLAQLEECFERIELLKNFFKDCEIEFGVQE